MRRVLCVPYLDPYRYIGVKAGVLKLVGAPILLAREILKSANVIFYKKFTTAVVFFLKKITTKFSIKDSSVLLIA